MTKIVKYRLQKKGEIMHARNISFKILKQKEPLVGLMG